MIGNRDYIKTFYSWKGCCFDYKKKVKSQKVRGKKESYITHNSFDSNRLIPLTNNENDLKKFHFELKDKEIIEKSGSMIFGIVGKLFRFN